MNVNAIRKVTIQGESQGLDALATDLNKVAAAEGKVAQASQATATITDMATKRALSARDAYARQTLAVVEGARAQDQLVRAMKVAETYFKQGQIEATEYAQRISDLKDRYAPASRASEALSKATTGLSNVFSIATGALAAFGVALGGAALIGYGKKVFDTTADLQEQADQVLGAGGNVEALQALRGVFLTNGIAMEEGDKILARLTRSLGEAAQGSQTAQDAFHRLHLGATQLAGKTADAALPLVAQKLLEVKDASKRAAIEADLFGKTGQQMESALGALNTPMDQLIARAKELGIVIDRDMIKKADDAKDSMSLAFTKLSVAIAPVVVEWGDKFAKLVGNIDKVTKSLTDLWDKAKMFAGLGIGARVGFAVGGIPGAVVGGVAGLAAAGPTQNQLSSAVDRYNAQLAGGGLSPSERAEITRRRDSALANYNSGVGYSGLVSRAGAAPAAANDNRGGGSWAPSAKDLQNAERLKETFDSYLQAQQEAARVAGQTAIERATESAVIKAAQIAQNEADKEHNLKQKDLVKTYADAAKLLGEGRVEQVRTAVAAQQLNPLEKQIADQVQLANTALASGRDERELAVQIEQKKLEYGTAYTDEIGKQLRLKQRADDATRMKDYLEDLRTEVQLAGMSADERERAAAAIQAGHMHATDAQKDEIQGLIAMRQETQRWREVVDQITNGFQSFFEDVLNNGKISFQSLWDSIKQSFVQMLAYMASQALVAPIIIPMVQSFAGAVGSTSFGGSGGGILGTLGNIGSAGSLFSGSGGLFGGLFGGGAAAAGSAGVQAQILAASGLPASFSTGAASTGLLGSLSTGNGLLGSFGGGFTGFLGGAGVGALASNLIFGNKNDAGLGGLGGAAAGAAIGSIIPGVGTVLGGLIGGLAGGGLGSITGSSNQGAISNFTNNGLGNTLFKAGGGNNGQLATQATSAINAIVQQLMDAGISVAMGNISGLSIGSDKSYVYGFDGMKEKLAGGEAGVQATVTSILNKVLPSASGGDDITSGILAKYQANGGLNAGNITQLVQDIQTAQAAKDQADQQAAALAQKVAEFGPAIAKALKAIQDPIGAQYDELIASQKSRLAQAQALGADVSQLDALNNAEVNKFLSGLSLNQMTNLAQTVDILGTSAYTAARAAQDLADAQAALTEAHQAAAQDASDAAQRVQAAQDQLNQSYNAQLQALQTSMAQYQNLADSLRGFLGQIGGGSANPLAQYNFAKGIFSSTAALAQGGDAASLAQLQQVSTEFLNASKAASVSLADYRRDRTLVTGVITASAVAAQAQADSAGNQIAALNKMVDGLLDTNKKLVAVADAVAELQDALSDQNSQIAANTKKVADLLTRVTRDGESLLTAAA